MKRIFSIVALIAALIPAKAKTHTLFSNGKSDYVIVVAENASESEVFGAGELQNSIREISGATLPVTGLNGGKKGRRIIIGYNALTAKAMRCSAAPEFADESFTYANKGGDIYIWGGGKRGSLYGVYSFLEEEFGCRWYSSKVSVTPKREGWTFEKLYNHEAPGIAVRNVFYKDAFNPLWAVRNRSNGTMGNSGYAKYGGGESFWGGHTFNLFVNPDKYFETHPEYFSEVNGERVRERTQLCLSNPDVLRIVTEELRKVMRNDPGHLIYSVGQNDWENPCQCEKCNAIKKQYGNTEAGILLWFVNQIADAVKDEFPDKYVGTFAYMFTRTPPENIRPRDNVVVRLCSIETCALHGMDDDGCKENASFRRDLQGWSAIAPHLFIWDYVSTFSQYLAPMPNVWTFQNRMQCFRDNNAIGVMPQGNYQSIGSAFDELKAYVLARVMWNPDCDVDAVIDDFLNGYFGAAGPAIREYMKFERASLMRPGVHEGFFPALEYNTLYTVDFIRGGREIFRKAYEAVAGQQEYVERVERAEIALCFEQMMYDPRKGYDSGALDLIKRVAERDHITHICEWGWYQTFDSFYKNLDVCPYLSCDNRDAGEMKVFASEQWCHLMFADVSDAEPGPVKEKLLGAKLISHFIKGYNGRSELYLFVNELAGGQENASYHFSGTIEPDKEYKAVCDGNWMNETATFEGFDESRDCLLVITDVDPAQLTFKFVQPDR